jgi:phage host-nuclease inhibitor protein Gam
MTRRIKTLAPQIQTRAQADELLGEVRSLVIEQAEIELTMEREIQQIQETHAKRLDKIKTALTAMVEQLERWADENRTEFGKLKSLEMTHGQIGWRMSTPSLGLLKKVTWKEVLRRLMSMRFRRFVRNKPEVAKDLLLAYREKLEARGLLEKIGVEVVQEESFFAEPTVPETEARQEVAA